jgi:hypothetical protein
VIIGHRDQGAIIQHSDEDQHEDGHLEEVDLRAAGAGVLGGVQGKDGNEEESDQLQGAGDTGEARHRQGREQMCQHHHKQAAVAAHTPKRLPTTLFNSQPSI